MSAALSLAGPKVVDADVAVVAVRRGGGICRLSLDWPPEFAGAGAGRFALLKSLRPGAPLLPRPLSLVPTPDGLEVVFNIVREGTAFLAAAEPGEAIALIGPLGNTFSLPREPAMIVADAPHVGTMLALGLERRAAGLADTFVFLSDPAEPHPGDAALLVELDAAGLAPQRTAPAGLRAVLERAAPRVLAVGAANAAMARVQAFAREHGIAGEAALQAAMACGLGVCHVCIHPARVGAPFLVCEGPVFDLARPDFGEGAGGVKA